MGRHLKEAMYKQEGERKGNVMFRFLFIQTRTIRGMMWAIIRRKAASVGSSNLLTYGSKQYLGIARPALTGSMSQSYVDAILTPEAPALGRNPKLTCQIHQGHLVHSMPTRIAVSSLKTDFSTQMWSRSFSSDSGMLFLYLLFDHLIYAH
ncbi:hypothetical protein R6Q57_015847 [Mikania cordata]